MQSPLAGFVRSMPYALPEGYFDQLAQALAQGIIWIESEDPTLELPRTMPFEIPEAYLSELPRSMTEAAIISDERNSRVIPFDVPDNYFNTLPGTLLIAAQTADKPATTGKTIAFKSMWQRKALQWAVAAMLVLGAGLGAYRYTHPSSPDAAVMEQLARVDGNLLNAYVEQHIDEFDADMLEASAAGVHAGSHMPISGLDEQEIYQYLSEEGAM